MKGLTQRGLTWAGDLGRQRPRSTEGLLGAIIVVAYAATLPLLQDLSPSAYPIVPFAGLGVVGVLVLVTRYPAVLLGAYAGGAFSLPFLVLPTEANPVRGWSLLPVATIAMYLLTRRGRVSLRLDAAAVSQVGFATIVLAGVIYTTGSTSAALDKAWRFLYLSLFLFLATAVFAGDARSQQRVLAGYTVSAVLWAGGVFVFGGYSQGRLGFEELAGPIVYGRACGIAATLMAAWLVSRPDRISVLVAVPVGLFALYGTVLSGTRGAVVALIVAVLAVFLASLIRLRARRHLLIACSVVIGVAGLIGNVVRNAPEELAARYAQLAEGTSGESAAGRIYLYSVAARMFSESPLLGKGTGAYPSPLQYPHNILLETAAELGLVGLLALCCSFTVTMAYALRVLRSPDYNDGQKRMIVFLAGGFVFFLVEAQFSGDITKNRLIWFFSGLMCGVQATKTFNIARAHLPAALQTGAGDRPIGHRPAVQP